MLLYNRHWFKISIILIVILYTVFTSFSPTFFVQVYHSEPGREVPQNEPNEEAPPPSNNDQWQEVRR